MTHNKPNQPLLIVISGPSGSGKTTICREVSHHFNMYYSVSHTTRTQRENEIDGQDYFFITKELFMKMIENNEFLEWAQVYQNYYGTASQVINDKILSNQSVIIDADTQGAINIKKIKPEAILIFIKTQDIEELKKRLLTRGRDSKDEIEKRLNNTKKELEKTSEYDHIVINDHLPRAIAEVCQIITSYQSKNNNKEP